MVTKKKVKTVPETYIRGKYAYKRVGSFTSRSAAVRYKNQTLHSIMLTRDVPRQMGVGVRYHVYRRVQ